MPLFHNISVISSNRGGNDIKDMKMLFITIQTENLERKKND
jgi:hypothetical protein